MQTGRFVVLSDTHFLAPGAALQDNAWWNRALQTQCAEIGQALVQSVRALQPDFVIHCGDFTGHCDPVNFEFGRAIMDRLGCPWYAVPGNHDTWFPGVRAALAAHHGLPGEHCYFSRDLAGLHFVFLDCTWWTSRQGQLSPYLDRQLYDQGQIAGMGPSPGELAWLEADLSAHADRPTVLVSHAPLGYQPDQPAASLPRGRPAAGPRTCVAALMGDLLQRETIRQLLRRQPQVRAAFAGHWHIAEVTREDGMLFCQTASLREYPFEFRLVTVDGQRLSVRTVGLDEMRFREESYVADWGNAWVAGAPEDRDFVIPLERQAGACPSK